MVRNGSSSWISKIFQKWVYIKNLKISTYIWEDIIVIEESEGKYKVQKYPEGPIKIVNRLAIKFKN